MSKDFDDFTIVNVTGSPVRMWRPGYKDPDVYEPCSVNIQRGLEILIENSCDKIDSNSNSRPMKLLVFKESTPEGTNPIVPIMEDLHEKSADVMPIVDGVLYIVTMAVFQLLSRCRRDIIVPMQFGDPSQEHRGSYRYFMLSTKTILEDDEPFEAFNGDNSASYEETVEQDFIQAAKDQAWDDDKLKSSS